MLAWVAWKGAHDPRQPQGRAVLLPPEQVRATIDYLRLCQKARAAGHRVAYTTDPEWLLDVAINRRAGWPDDPGVSRGSAMPVKGRFPKRASDDWAVYQFVRQLNGSRWHPRVSETRWLPRRIRDRIAHRIRSVDDY